MLVFLDSHSEVNSGWLEPLLTHIAADQRRLAIPTIDVIRPDTLEYYPTPPYVRGGFDWMMYFQWGFLPEHLYQQQASDPTKPIMYVGPIFLRFLVLNKEVRNYWGSEEFLIECRLFACKEIVKNTIRGEKIGVTAFPLH